MRRLLDEFRRFERFTGCLFTSCLFTSCLFTTRNARKDALTRQTKRERLKSSGEISPNETTPSPYYIISRVETSARGGRFLPRFVCRPYFPESSFLCVKSFYYSRKHELLTFDEFCDFSDGKFLPSPSFHPLLRYNLHCALSEKERTIWRPRKDALVLVARVGFFKRRRTARLCFYILGEVERCPY